MEWEVPEWDAAGDSWEVGTLQLGKRSTEPKKQPQTKKQKVTKEQGIDKKSPKKNVVEAQEEKSSNVKTEAKEEDEFKTVTKKKNRKRKNKIAGKQEETNEQPEIENQKKEQVKEEQAVEENLSKKKKKKDKKEEKKEEKNEEETKGKNKKGKANDIAEMKEKLKGSRFRWLNEQLYTTESTNSLDLFQNDPSLFFAYHEGFRNQVVEWPENPVQIFISFLKKNPKLVVGDFGCGDAEIAGSVPNKVHSFDLVAANDKVTACDIAHVPLENETLDVAIYSLSLMGVNVVDFLTEAHRVLKPNGKLKIAEVKSRFNSIKQFINVLNSLGFDLVNKDESNKMFVLFDFVKNAKRAPKKNVKFQLKPCLYKRR